MASHTSLRQASRLAQSNKSYLAPSRIRQHSQSPTAHSLLSSRTSSFSRHPQIRSQYVLQQSRNLSWWGSGASTSSSAPPQVATPVSNLDISEPSDLQSIIAPDRAFRASSNISSAELEARGSSTPSPLEPQFLEDAQQAIVQPHFTDPESLPANLEEIPERIGYLKEVCGLDFGWGPTSTVQFLLEQLHITGGYSWTASIVLLGFAVRAIVFPALVGAAKQTQKMRDVKDVIAPIQAEYTAAKEKGDQKKMGQAAQQLMAVRKDFGVQIWKAFLPPLLQIPFGFGCWRLLRNSATVPVPGFVTESWLWTTDLTFSDPYYIAPALSALLIWGTMRVNRRVNVANPTSESVMVIFMKCLPPITFLFMSFQPGAVQLYFVASSTVGLLSAVILQQRVVRMFFGMPPLTPVASTKIPAYIAPVVSKLGGGASITPKAPGAAPPPLVKTKAIGGLHRHSRAERIAEAERAAELAAQQNPERQMSRTDVVVDGAKKHFGQIRQAGKNIASSIKSAAGVSNKKRSSPDAESYEYNIQQKLENQRQARNEKSRGKK